MYRKCVYFTLFFLLVCSLFQSQVDAREKPKIAVVDIKYESSRATGKLSSTLIVNKIASDLVKTGRFDILERVQIEEVLKEQNFPQILKGEEYDCQKLGKLLGAQAIVTGTAYYGQRTITKRPSNIGFTPFQLFLGILFPPLLFVQPPEQKPYTVNVSTYSLAIKVVDVETGKIITSEDLLESDLGGIGDMTKRLYVKLLDSYPVKGAIVGVDGNNVYVDLGKDVGLRKNDVLEVYKPEKVIKKGTIEVMTLPEEKIGEIEVRNVSDAAAMCQVIPHLTNAAIEKDYAVKLIAVEALEIFEIARRHPKEATRLVGMGGASIGHAVGSELVKHNPAGLAQVSEPEINLGWNFHYNSSSFRMPNTGENFSGVKGFYGSFVENLVYPSEFNGIMPLERTAVGLHLDVDDMHINNDVFTFDNGGLNLGIYSGRAISPTIFVGGGLNWTDKWIGIHRIVNSVDNSFQFRGSSFGLKAGVLFRPDPKLGVGGVVNLATEYSGTLKETGASPSERKFNFGGVSNVGVGLSYKAIDRLVLNMDVLTYFNPSWYDARIGLEYSLSDSIALRLGTYNNFTRIPDFADDPNYPSRYDIRTNVYTGGIGYTTDTLFFDISGEYEVLKDQDIVIYPDFSAGSDVRTLLGSYKEVRIKINVGSKF